MTIKFKYIPESDSLLQEIETHEISTIKDIKLKISENQDIDIKNIKIIFLGKVLEDEQLITECKLDNDSTVHVIIKKKNNTNNQNNTESNHQYNNTSNTNNFTNVGNIFNQLNENFQNEEFQNNVNSLLNTVGQFQQNLQNTVQNEEFQNNLTNVMGQFQQNLQNTVQNEEFQNDIANTINSFTQGFQTQNNHQYNEEEENKINSLLNLNIINDRNQIINLLEDNGWNQETVANTLIFYSE